MSPLARTLLAAGLAAVLAGCTRQTPLKPVLVGYLAPDSGATLTGLQLAVKEANETEELVAGRRVALLAPKLAEGGETLQAVATRLVTVNGVSFLIGGQTAEQAAALGRAAPPAGALVVVPAELSTVQLGDNVFPAALAPADQGTLLARHAVAQLKAERVAVLAGPEPHHADLAAAFVQRFKKDSSARRVDRLPFDGKTAWDTLAAKVRDAAPAAVVIAGSAADLTRLRTALHEAGVKVPFLFGSTLAERLPLEANQQAGQDVYVATLYVPENDPRYGDFAANYQNEFGTAPGVPERLGYEAGKMLIAALRRSKLQSRDRVREELAKAYVVRLEEGKPSQPTAYSLLPAP